MNIKADSESERLLETSLVFFRVNPVAELGVFAPLSPPRAPCIVMYVASEMATAAAALHFLTAAS